MDAVFAPEIFTIPTGNTCRKNEIIKFSEKTKEEKKEFLDNVKNICFFNQELFLKINNNSFSEIIPNVDTDKILKFLINDINHII